MTIESRQIKECLSDALAEISAEGVPYYLWVGAVDESIIQISPGLVRMCKQLEANPEGNAIDDPKVQNTLRKVGLSIPQDFSN